MPPRNNLVWGLDGERIAAGALREKGMSVGKAPEWLTAQFRQGPRLSSEHGALVAPDLIAVTPDGSMVWIEVKRKTSCTWWMEGDQLIWQTGIDLDKYEHYLRTAHRAEVRNAMPFWLLFLQEPCRNVEGRGPCPHGLFGNNILALRHLEHHRNSRASEYGMVYWPMSAFYRLDDLTGDEITQLFNGRTFDRFQGWMPGLGPEDLPRSSRIGPQPARRPMAQWGEVGGE